MRAKIFKSGNSLALRIPKELQPVEGEMEIEVQGERWIVSPRKAKSWPEGFFDNIQLSDPAPLRRPPQGPHREIQL